MTDSVTIRSVSTQAEREACVALQRATWGRDFTDAVPASILQVTQKVGGVTAGAFNAKNELVGFVFGVTGIRDGKVVHWSDMLAVRDDVRGQGIGRRLKEFQRQEVARLGCELILWTYDPLVARNAHININVLGAVPIEYVRDMYGPDTGSDLHRGIGTDRLIVAWDVDPAKHGWHKDEAAKARRAGNSDVSRVDVPADIAALLGTKADEARRWRASVRKGLEGAANRRAIVGFDPPSAGGAGSYLVARADAH